MFRSRGPSPHASCFRWLHIYVLYLHHARPLYGFVIALTSPRVPQNFIPIPKVWTKARYAAALVDGCAWPYV